MDNKLYVFGEWPLKISVNPFPGDILHDIDGDIFGINDYHELYHMADSVLEQGTTVDSLTECTYKRLFVPITQSELKANGY